MTGARRATLLSIPVVFSLIVYWPGLWTWFQQDDFAWLGLHLELSKPSGWLHALLTPMAQGTIRLWSERLFFLVFHAVFGLDALPFRIAVFATLGLNLALVGDIAWRMTRSQAAMVLAPLVWAANPALGVPMSWTSSYNQILCVTFLAGALCCFLRYVETGSRRWYLAQWIVFVLGFGALELNVVYPGLALAWALCCARHRIVSTLPMFAVSGVYTLAHSWISPKPASGPYAMHWDLSMPETLGRYAITAFGGSRLAELPQAKEWATFGQASAWLLAGAVIGFLGWSLWRRRFRDSFGVLWFLTLIAPVVPLRDHFSDYYLTAPAVGLGLLAAGAWASATRVASRALVAAAACVYAGTSAPVGRAIAEFHYDRSRKVEDLVMGVQAAGRIHRGKTILLTGVGTDLFWSGVHDKPFRLLGLHDVWLAPGAEENIRAFPELGSVSDFVFPAGPALRITEKRQAVVYAAGGERLRNITGTWLALARLRWKPGPASRVDAGHPAFADQLGSGWYDLESGYRWMADRAVVWLGGPGQPGQQIHIKGFYPEEGLAGGPLRLTVRIEGIPAGNSAVEKPGAFEFRFALPPATVGRARLEVELELSRVFVDPKDGRRLGAAFGILEIR